MSIPKLTKEDIGRSFYFIEPVTIDSQVYYIVYYGILISIMPKYQYTDTFSNEYAREENYIFRIRVHRGGYSTKATTSLSSIFENLQEATFTREAEALLSPSVALELQGE